MNNIMDYVDINQKNESSLLLLGQEDPKFRIYIYIYGLCIYVYTRYILAREQKATSIEAGPLYDTIKHKEEVAFADSVGEFLSEWRRPSHSRKHCFLFCEF